MRTESDQTITISDIEEQVIDALRDTQRVQERLTDVLAHLIRFREQTQQTQPPAGTERREAVLNLLSLEHLTIEGIARQFSTSPRSIRRIMDKARNEGDMRVAHRYKKNPPTEDSSLSVSHSQRNDASDPALVGVSAAALPADSSRSGQSEEESTEERTDGIDPVEAQAGKESGDAPTVQHSVLAGTAEEDTETPSSAATKIVGPNADTAIIDQPFPWVSLGEAAAAIVKETMEAPLEEVVAVLDKDIEVLDKIEATLEQTVQDEPVTVGVDLAKGPDVHVEVVVEKTAAQPVTYKAIAEKLRQRKAEKRQTAKPAPLVGPAGILVNVQNGILSGAHGNLRVEKPVAKVLEHMADGGLYPIDILAQKGGYPKKAMVGDMLQAWKHRFEKIGVEVVFLGKELAKLQAAGA
jgi:hypothetical protein